MKFLCIHGMGTSGLIFETELKKYIEALGCDNEYVFINGANECGPAASKHSSTLLLRNQRYSEMYQVLTI